MSRQFLGGVLVVAVVASCGDDGKAKLVDSSNNVDVGGDTAPPSSAMITVSPLSSDFGSVEIGQSSPTATFSIGNAGQGTTGAITATVAGAGAASFTAATTCQTLGASATCTISVTFSPTTVGAKTATLVVAGTPGGSVSAALDGVGLGGTASALTITPSSAQLGTVTVGASGTPATFTVHNVSSTTTGALSLQPAGSDPTQFALAADTCTGKTLAGGADCTFTLAFAPTAAGQKSATVAAFATPGGTVSAAVSGVAIAPGLLVVTPTAQGFGTVAVGTKSGIVMFNLVNAGGTPTGTLTPSLTGAAASSFEIATNTCSGALDPGATCQVSVRFAPSAAGLVHAALSVPATPGGSPEAQLDGTGVLPGALAISPSAIAFNNISVGMQSAATTITISNTGGNQTGALALALGSVDFTTSNDTCTGASLPGGGTCTIDVKFAPTSAGAKVAALSALATPGGLVSSGLSGTGIPAAQLSISPTLKDFGTIGTGTQSPFQTFTVTNLGGSPSGAPAGALSGANAAAFELMTGCTAQLAPLASCDVQVRFKPVDPGAQIATLSVAASPGGSANATLFGQGADPAQLASLPASLAFTTLLGDTATQSFTVRNNGVEPTGSIVISKSGASAAEFALTSTCPDTLGLGATCVVSVAFSPTSIGNHGATVIIAASPGGSTTVALSGSVKPRLEVVTVNAQPPVDPFDFGGVVLGASPSPQATIIVRNNTTSAQTVTSSIDAAAQPPFALAGSPCAGIVPAGGTCSATVQFVPTAAGPQTGGVTFSIGPTIYDLATQRLAGTGVDGLSLTPVTVADFGNVTVGATSPPLIFTATNHSSTQASGALVLSAITEPYSLQADTCSGAQLDPGASCQLTLVFHPTSLGPEQASVQVTGTPGGAPSVMVTGTGVNPTALYFNPNPAAFGGVFSGTTKDISIVVTNPAGAQTSGPISFAVTGDAAYVLQAPIGTDCTTGQTLANGQTCTLRVRFSPTVHGAKAGSLTVTASPGTPGAGAVVPLTGTSMSTLSVAPTTFAFGTLESGETKTKSFAVHNESAATATVTSEVFSGTSTAMSVSADNCLNQPLLAGASCQVTVEFAPTVLTDDVATLTISTASADGIAAISPITGHGNPPPNSAPTALSLSSQAVAENAAAPTAIGTFTSTDPDDNNTFTYTLVPGAGATDNGSFAITGAALRATASFDYEATPTRSIRVRTTDQGGLFFEQQFTITVTDVNETATTVTLTAQTIAENAASGTLIGMLGTDDPDAGEVTTFAFDTGGADNAKFSINGKQLLSAQAFDHETTPMLSITIKATDSANHVVSKPFTITVTDVNEAPAAATLSPATIAEDKASGTTVGTLAAIDPDAGDTLTYTLVAGAGSTDNASFTITGAALKTATALDFETKSSYAIRVRATDAGGLLSEAALTVTITDVNEAPTNVALSPSSIAENQPSGTTVGTFTTTDVDSGDTFSYTLVAGSGSTDNASFTIAGGALKTAASFNFESQATYAIRVRVTDSGSGTFEKALTVTVSDVNEAPTNVALTPNHLDENQPSGTAVGTLSATDPDAGNTFTFALAAGGTDNASFSISGNQLVTAAAFDYETKSSYSISVKVTDNGSLTFTKTLIVTVDNVNEAPTDIALTSTSIAENQASGSVVGTLSATDGDAGDTFTYALSGADAASFSIAGSQLKTAAAFDYETKNSYSITVQVTDSASHAFSKPFTITVTNVNEAPTNLTLSNSTIAENQASGTAVGTLGQTDPDSGNTFTFAFAAGGADNGSFAISGTTLQTAAVFDYETKNSYSINLKVTDQGGLAYTKAFVVTVTNVNEAPAAQNQSHAATGNVSYTTAAGTLLAGAADPESDALHVQAASGATTQGGTVVINTDGSYTYDPPAGYAGSDTFAFSVCDPSNACGSATVTVTIADMLWFIDSACSSNCDGRLSHPFASVGAFSTANTGASRKPATGQTLFIAQAAATYAGTLTLQSGQKLVGQDARTSSLAAIAGITLAADSASLPAFNSVDAVTPVIQQVTLATSNRVQGLIAQYLVGTSVGALTLLESSAINTSGAQLVALANGVFTNGSQLDFVTGATSSASGGIQLTNLSGLLTIGAGTLTASGPGVVVTNGTVGLTVGMAIAGTSIAPVSISAHGTGALTFNGAITGTGGALQIANSSGTYAFNGATNLSASSGVAISGSSAAVTFGAGTAIDNEGGSVTSFSETGGSTSVTFNGTIVNKVGAPAVSIANKLGGTDSFTGAITTATTGTANSISISSTTGATTSFTGALDLHSVTGTTFSVATGGVVSAPNAANKLVATGAQPLVITSPTTIGATGMAFASANGQGIAVASTGGSLRVTGDGQASSADTTRGRSTAKQGGGTLTLGSGGTLSGGTGVVVSGTTAITLRNMVITTATGSVNDGKSGIKSAGNALTLDNLLLDGNGNGMANNSCLATSGGTVTITHSVLSNCATTSGVESADVWGTELMTPTVVTIDASVFDTSRENVVALTPAATTTATVTNSAFQGANIAGVGNDCLFADNSAGNALTLSVTGSSFLGCWGSSFQYGDGSAGGTGALTVGSNTFDSAATGDTNGSEVSVLHQGSGTLVVNVINNSIRQAVGGDLDAIAIVAGSLGTSATILAKITGNTIGKQSIMDSGAALGAGIFVDGRSGTITSTIANNVIHQVADTGIYVLVGRESTSASQPIFNSTITGNDVTTDDIDSASGLTITYGNGGTTPDAPTGCLSIGANTRFVATSGSPGISFNANGTSALSLQSYAGAQNNNAQIKAFLASSATTVSPNPTVPSPAAQP